jgi:hypothetical protein
MKKLGVGLFLFCLAAFGDDHAPVSSGGGGGGGGDAGGQGNHGPVSTKDPNRLRPFGEGTNRSFDIRIPLKPEKKQDAKAKGEEGGNDQQGGRFGDCQATRIAGKKCMLATAAHCVEDYDGKSVTIETADFGKVSAKVTLNPEYAKAHEEGKGKETTEKKPDGSTVIHTNVEKPFDIALLDLGPEACQSNGGKKVEAQPVCKETPKPDTTVYAASSHFGKLLVGKVQDPGDPVKPSATQAAGAVAAAASPGLGAIAGAGAATTSSVGKAPKGDWISVLIDQWGIKQGDSGGGLFVKSSKTSSDDSASSGSSDKSRFETQLCWAGVLSGTPERNPTGNGFHLDSHYAADKAMVWVKTVLEPSERKTSLQASNNQ